MKNLVKRNLSNLTAAALGKRAGALTKCCYFILHQPKETQNLKLLSKDQK